MGKIQEIPLGAVLTQAEEETLLLVHVYQIPSMY